MYDYSYDYSDKSIDEILESMVFGVNDLLHEMDLMIIKANYRYLRETGEEMSPGQQVETAEEVKESWWKRFWNWVSTPFRWVKDKVLKLYYNEKKYVEEDLRYMERGFDLLASDRSITFNWRYMIQPALILHKPVISDSLINALMKITPDDDYRDKFIDYRNKIRKIFAKSDTPRTLPVMIKKQDLLAYYQEDRMVRRAIDSVERTANDFKKLFNKKTAPKDFLKLSGSIAADIINQSCKFIKDTNTYFNTVAKTCIRLGKQAAKEEMYTSSTNESYMFDTMFDDTFDDLYY